MPAPITLNEELAAATDHGEFKFVLMLAPLASGTDSDNELVHDHGVCV